MPLVENGRIVNDRYERLDDTAPIAERTAVIVSARRFLAQAGALARRDGSLGVLWPNDQRVAELQPWLGHLALIALDFPKFRDGRAYSQARLLREQYGFCGTLRATGEILRDQFVFLLRAGFNSLEVKKPADAAAFAEVVGRFSVFYQPSTDGRSWAQRRRMLGTAVEPVCAGAAHALVTQGG
ncbi:MAG: DUF934 domain-containing protein [Xanthobacteraceae bacterium]